MKRCPTCERTFDDSMRFCQSDGTPLVEDTEPVDPYKTMVARGDELANAMPKPNEGNQDNVLELPDDSKKTVYASEEEIRREMGGSQPDEQVIDIPPYSDRSEQDSPGRGAAGMSPPSFGDVAPPPSPFSASEGLSEERERSGSEESSSTTPPIPSPFDEPKSSPFDVHTGGRDFKEPEPRFEPSSSPFDQASSQSEWTPAPAPVGQTKPFSPPGAPATEGENKTLAIVSLVLGILSLFCCAWFLPGVAAVITGFIAKNKAEQNPGQYGGRGLALAGIITGGISVALGIIVMILYLFTGILSGIGNM